MPTKISYQTWKGGEGCGDSRILLGYCKEEPKEVLKQTYKNYYIYNYRGLYRPIDYSFPNNVSGLVIEEINDDAIPGCKINGSLKDLDISIAYSEEIKRDVDVYQEGIENAKKWHCGFNYNTKKISLQYRQLLEEVENITFLKGAENMIGKEEREAVMRVIDSRVLSGYQGNWSEAFYGGKEVKALEKEWQEYFNVKHAVVCNSATSGLWMALAAIGLQSICLDAGEMIDPYEIIVSPYSMTCSASVPLHFGAVPIFADIEKEYYCLDPKSIEERITERTKAIIVVDLFGLPADYDAINAIAKKHNLYVIEDAAQAIGATYKGKYAGTLGDIGVFSLNHHKHINCGEGGVVVTDNDELAFKIRMLANHAEAVSNDMEMQRKSGRDFLLNLKYQLFNLVGLNLRMTELQACIAREQLKKLDGILKIIRDYAKHFDVKVRPGCEHAYYRYVVNNQKFLDKFNRGLPNEYFNIKRHYIVPLYKLPLFKSLGYPDNLCPVCEQVEENIVLAWLKDVA